MARERRRRSRRGASSSQSPDLFSRIGGLIPDAVENPAKAVVKFPFGLTGNLAADVKDAVVGLPMGIITTGQHPVRAVENIGKSYWHTYSPFFTGNPIKGLQNLYDHPLAPILDVATVFTLGAAGAARGAGALSKAGSTSSTVKKIADLREPKTVARLHPDDPYALPLTKNLSRRPGRRIVQEAMLKYPGPQWFQRAGYNRAKLGEMARRSVTAEYIQGQAHLRAGEIEKAVKQNDRDYFSNRFQMEAVMQGGQALEDITELGKRARTTVYAHMHANLMRHNDAFDEDTARAMLAENDHLTAIKAPEFMDSRYWAAVDQTSRAHAKAARRNSSWRKKYEAKAEKLEGERAKHAELANSVERIERELVDASNELQNLYAEGWQVANPARSRNPKGIEQMTHESRRVDDAVARVRNLEAMRAESLVAKQKHQEALDGLESLRQQREDRDFNAARLEEEMNAARDRSAEDFYRNVGEDYDTFVKHVDNFGRHATTQDLSKAARAPDGGVYLVPKHDAYNLAFEGGNSLRFIHKVLHKPTMIWKTAVIGYTPRTITNNAVGNWFLYTVREMPSSNGIMAVADAIRFRFGSKVAGEALFPTDHWLHRYFSDEMADQFGVGNELVRFGDTSTMRRLKGGPFYLAQRAIAEEPLRAATLYKAMRDNPEVKAELAALRKSGVRGTRAVDTAIERVLARNPDARDEAAQYSRRLAGDYITLSEGEKFVRDIVPFYLWSRHILKTTGNMFADQPVKLALMSHLSEMGIEATEETLGEIPEFLRGAIPLSALGFGDRTGRKNVMLTASLNPFATVGELAESADAFITGSGRRGAAVSQLNPFMVGGFESVFEVNALSGNPSPREGGVLADVLRRTLGGLPQAKLADELTKEDTLTTPKGNDYLYARDDRSPLSSFLGIPLRNVSEEAAANLASEGEETTGRRRRRRRRG